MPQQRRRQLTDDRPVFIGCHRSKQAARIRNSLAAAFSPGSLSGVGSMPPAAAEPGQCVDGGDNGRCRGIASSRRSLIFWVPGLALSTPGRSYPSPGARMPAGSQIRPQRFRLRAPPAGSLVGHSPGCPFRLRVPEDKRKHDNHSYKHDQKTGASVNLLTATGVFVSRALL